MDLARIIMVVIVAAVGWLLAIPLAAVSNHLLASVAADEAAPVAYAPALATNGEAELAIAATMPLMLTPAWRWTLHGGMALALPLALGRMLATPAFHPANLLTAGMFVLCALALVLIAVLDGAAHLIFVEIVAPTAVMVALVGVVAGHGVWLPMLMGAIVGGLFFLGLYALGQLLYGTDALGLGDVELAIAFGVMLGWPLMLSGIIAGMLAMAVVSGILLALRRITTRTYMPIGAFLALGTLATLVLVPPIWLA